MKLDDARYVSNPAGYGRSLGLSVLLPVPIKYRCQCPRGTVQGCYGQLSGISTSG